MNTHAHNLLSGFLGQLLPFLFSFLDDAVLLGLSHLGFHWQWMQWFSPIMLSGTLCCWMIRLVNSQYKNGSVMHSP